MMALSEFSATTPHHRDLVYARWADPSTWPRWDPEVRSVTFAGPAVVGARGRLRPRSGPASAFVITEAMRGEVFTNTGSLPGAKLDFVHRVQPELHGGSTVTITVRLRGPLAPIWKRILGSGLRDAARSSGEGLLTYLDGNER